VLQCFEKALSRPALAKPHRQKKIRRAAVKIKNNTAVKIFNGIVFYFCCPALLLHLQKPCGYFIFLLLKFKKNKIATRTYL
jgi:hypothetical protein